MQETNSQRSIESSDDFITRRKMMAAGAAAVGAGLAGCQGGSSSGGDSTIRTYNPSIPTEWNFNPWATSYPWTPSWMFLETMTRNYTDGTVSMQMVEDWNYDTETNSETVTFNQDWYWWNGDQITAADKYWFEQVQRAFNPEASAYEELSLEDNGQTIVRQHKQPQNPQLIEYGLGGYLGVLVRGHRDKYRPWAEEMLDASTEEERTDIQERMAEEMPLNVTTVMEEGLGAAPFEITDVDEQRVIAEKFEDHPFADDIEIDTLEYALAQNQAVAQQIQGGDLDFGYGLLQEHIGEGNAPSHAETVASYPDTFMRKLDFHMNGPASEHLRKLRVRRAIAHVVNLTFISDNTSGRSSAREGQTGLTNAVTSDRLGDYTSDFIQYPFEDDTETATSLMNEEGYEMSGGNWTSEDGETVSMEIVVPNYLSNPARTIADQLSQFGFGIDLNVLEDTAYTTRVEDSKDFDLGVESHGGTIAHPWYFFRPNHSAGLAMGEQQVIEGALADGETRTPFNGKELIVEIPTEVGQEDLSGSTEEINLWELHREWQTAQTDERNQEIARKFSWYWNFHLPHLDMMEMISGAWGKTADWNFDVNEEWEAYRGSYRGLKRGLISPK